MGFRSLAVIGVALALAATVVLRAADEPAPVIKTASVTFPADGKIDFVRDVQPILRTSCVECHNAEQRKGRLRLDAKSMLARGGQSGQVVTPGKSADSTLIKRVTGAGGEKQMPFKRPPLPEEQIKILKAWIDQGAKWPDGIDGEVKPDKQHWAFVKPVRPSEPAVKTAGWARNPIDSFVLARLEKEGLKPSPEADRATLIRRVTLDLTGLPPTLAEIDAFLNDASSDAYDKVVDRLLASPHYGERWARQWLDLARYADTNGYEKDRPRNIYPYRDWVISALNRDLPFNEFTIEQIAGDMLPNATPDQIIATGFHRNTLWSEEGGVDLAEFRFKALVDRMETTAKGWLGLTLQCAQCHNHKYDPITQKEYYGLFAMLNNADEPEYKIPDAKIAAKREEVEAQIAKLESKLGDEFPLEDVATKWAVLKPLKLKAASGAALSASEDGTVVASGTPGASDKYTFQVDGELAGATSIRLEALTDPSLPKSGPGRAPNGNFVLSELKVGVVQPKGKPKPVALTSPKADFSQPNYDIAAAIDGNPGTGWAIDDGSGSLNKNRTATFQLAAPLAAGTKKLSITIEQNEGNHALGKFRISAGRPEKAATASGEDVATRRKARLEKKFAEWQETMAAKSGKWTVLRPTHMESEGHATMATRDDGSVLVTGDWPNQDVYTVDLATPTTGVTAIKLEVLPDESLPENGPGRAPLFMPGDFLLGEFELNAGPKSATGELPAVKPSRASQDFASPGRSAALALDGRIDTGWSIGPRTGEAHQAVFVLPKPLGDVTGTRMQIKLVSKYVHQTTIGRFRISVTTDPKPADASELPPEVEQIFATTKSESRTPEQVAQLKHCFLEQTPELAGPRQKIAELRKSEPQYQRTLVMRERSPENARVTHLHHRGEFLQEREVVQPAVLPILHPLPPGAPANRLGLAMWLVDENNPLVGRVVMNRAWAAFFGRGIVNTVEDFGLMGEPPSHPKLLDWLATEFIRQKWSMKAMHRLIVTSATYRQDGRVTPELLQRDPLNILLARGPRNRVEAEMVRDVALSVSGLLADKIGGPSVFPPQPDGVSEQSYGAVAWVTSKGPDRWRRGLYTYLKRTSPYPAMLTFDAPNAETSCVRRVKSNTPLQALTMLNDQVFVEAAQALARRVLKESPSSDDAARVKLMFRLCTGREATADEVAEIAKFHASQASGFKDKPATGAEAVAVSEALPLPKDASAKDLAAWTVVARAMLNLDETITK
jgi:hypothetical protein